MYDCKAISYGQRIASRKKKTLLNQSPGRIAYLAVDFELLNARHFPYSLRALPENALDVLMPSI